MNDYVLIKGDISGIQEFIFNIKSKGAARALKARSFHIEILGWLAEEKVKKEFNGAKTIYNGGGNFYTRIPIDNWSEDKFIKLQASMLKELPKEGILSINLTSIPYDSKQPKLYGKIIKELNELTNRSKLAIHSLADNPISFFEPFQNEKKDDQSLFIEFTDELARSNYRDIQTSDSHTAAIAQLFGMQVKLHNSDPKTGSRAKIYRHIPLWRENEIGKHKDFTDERRKSDPEFHPPKNKGIVEFEYLSHFAYLRSGTDKLGILKMDIDNLGALFIKLEDEEKNQKLSDYLTNFFTEQLDGLLNERFDFKQRKQTIDGKDAPHEEKNITDTLEKSGKVKIKYYEYEQNTHALFRDNLYVVFAGGDDSFIIGGWDAVIEFALKIQKKFSDFESNIRSKDLTMLSQPITLSAAIVLVDAHFPVVKFAELVEDELHHAKQYANEDRILDASGKPMKNNIAFLGQVFRWEEFRSRVIEVKEKMLEMVVKYNAPKAFLQRIIESFENSDTDYWLGQPQKKPFDPALLWRFLYHFRDLRNEPYFRHYYYKDFFGNPTDSKLGGYYAKYVWDYFEANREASQILPTAARWTEFLTRTKQQDNG